MDLVRLLKHFKTWSPWQLVMAIAATVAGLSILAGSAYLVSSLTAGADPGEAASGRSERSTGNQATPFADTGGPQEGREAGGTGAANSGDPGFSISCSPGRFPSGDNAGANTCTVKSLRGFDQRIDLSCANAPRNLRCEFSPPSVIPPRDGYASFRLQLWWENVSPGTYTFRVVGQGGGKTADYQFPFRKADPGSKAYNVNCPLTATIPPGQQADVVCTIKSEGGFSGPVMLGCTRAGGIECRFDQNRVFLQPWGQSTARLTLTAPRRAAPGPREVLIQSYSSESDLRGGQPSKVVVEVPSTTPPSFRLDCERHAVSVVQGTSGSVSCTVRSVAGFEGDVTLNVVHQTGFVPYSVNPPSVTLSRSGAPVPVTLNLDATTLNPGNYGIYVSATTPEDSSGTQLELTVTPAAAPEAPPGGGQAP